jgi:threonine/homoserine/homoserine lactone efflux protein
MEIWVANLLKGLVLGLSIAAPVGQIGVLCIRRTLTEGMKSGFVSGLGAATADAIYGGVAAFGLTAISALLVGAQLWLRLAGGLFLVLLGLKTLFQRPAALHYGRSARTLLMAYLTTFLLTLANPTTIISFVAIFAGLQAGNSAHSSGAGVDAGWMVIGVFAGSTLWWLLLSFTIDRLRGRFRVLPLEWINRVSGGIITTLGFGALASVVGLL